MSTDSVNVGLYGNNPFAQYAAQGSGYPQQVRQNYGVPEFQGELENDRFERSESSPGLVSAVATTAAGGGIGAAAGYYWKGNPLKSVENGYVLDEKFAATYDAAKLNEYTEKLIEKRKLNALSSLGITDLKQYEAIQKLALGEELSEELQKSLPKNITTKEEALEFVKKAQPKLDKVNVAQIREHAKKAFIEKYSKEAVQAKIKNYTAMEEELTQLGKNATPQQLQEFIAKNQDKLGITNKKRLKAYTEKLSKMNQEQLLQELQTRNNGFKDIIKDFNNKILAHVDAEKGVLKAGSPKNLEAMFKSFRWDQLKRYGLWGAGIGFGAWLTNKFLSSK